MGTYLYIKKEKQLLKKKSKSLKASSIALPVSSWGGSSGVEGIGILFLIKFVSITAYASMYCILYNTLTTLKNDEHIKYNH